MKMVFESSEMGELQSAVKSLAPFRENEVRFIHYPKPTARTDTSFYYLERLVGKLGYDNRKYQVVTIAIGHDGRIGIAFCSRKDIYNRKLGNKIAGNRLGNFDKIISKEKERRCKNANDSA